MGSRLAVLALFAVGCSASTTLDPGAVGCPDGARPSFEACRVGAAWADCGGTTDGPVFACRAGGGHAFLPGCRWFVGACVPEGWTASPCSADAVCCVDDSPFDRETRQQLRTSVAVFLSEWGSAPRDRESSRNVAVELGPLDGSEPSIECTGAIARDRGPCRPHTVPYHLTSGGEVFILSTPTAGTGILFWILVLEVTRDADGSLHASACHVQTTDFDDGHCTTGLGSPDCAVSGTLVLDAFPETDEEASATRLALHAVFADGATIDVRL